MMDYEVPFDVRFRDSMVVTLKRLMDCGCKLRLAYAQSDEISLLFDPDEQLFNRKHRKWLSILAGEASAALSLSIGRHAVMDCRIIELPTDQLVVDYFRWRMEDAGRNCLNSHAYWILRKAGRSVAEATSTISGQSNEQKHELLRANGLSYDALPLWQKRGYAVVLESYAKEGYNPLTKETETAKRSRQREIFELPSGGDYSKWIAARLKPCHQ
jgi:tRNA(His) 5'-end guanylyltransferase